MTGAWTPESEPTSAEGSVTLVEGSSFCLCTRTGDLRAQEPLGVYFQDTRILSRWDLTVDGEQPEPLAALVPDAYRATFLGRLRRSGTTDTNLLVERDRRIGAGIREDVTVHNPGAEPVSCTVVLAVEADFADLFEVKAGRVRRGGERTAQADEHRLALDHRSGESHRGVIVDAPGGGVSTADHPEHAATIRYDVVVPARGRWSGSLIVRPVVEGKEVEPSFPFDRPVLESLPAVRLRSWQESTPVATTAHAGLQRVLRRSQQDLGALRIFDDDDPTLAAVAAGAPWFMALFGRDSLLSAYMALPLDPSLALGTLKTLARHQGHRSDPLTEEEPGRIVHEVRHGLEAGLSLGGGSAYYGTADATPLFVVLLGELARWGGDPEQIRQLLPHADQAIQWIERYGDRDGDGFVEYRRSTDHGLRNQGWKDSWDGVTFADGRPADPPIALCEVQGYVHHAFRARAELAQDLGDDGASPALDRACRRAQGEVQRTVLAAGARPLRTGSGPREAPRRLVCLEHGPLPVERDRGRRQGAERRRSAPVAGDVQRLGRTHPEQHHGRLRPGQLPQRLGVAPRQRPHRGGTHALRLRGRGQASRRAGSSMPPSASAAASPSSSAGSTGTRTPNRCPIPPPAPPRPGPRPHPSSWFGRSRASTRGCPVATCGPPRPCRRSTSPCAWRDSRWVPTGSTSR